MTPLWQRQIYMLARALVGEGWRAKGTPTRIPVGPSRAVELSTPSMHAPASASPPSRRTPGNSQGPVTRWTRDVCRQLPSRFHPIWPSTTSIHPPLRSWRPAQRTYNSRDALWFSSWTMRNGHHRQNCPRRIR